MQSEKTAYEAHPDDIGSDSEDDRMLQEARTSAEVADYDQQVLLDEEEKEELLAEKPSKGQRSFFRRKGRSEASRQSYLVKPSKSRAHKARQRKHDGKTDEAGEFLYEMEEGGAKDDTSSQASSSSMDELRGEKEMSKVG